MALTEPGMLCSLCRRPIAKPEDEFCTWAHVELHCHPEFSVLNDAAVHQACIDDWPERDRFLAFYNGAVRDELVIDSSGHVRYRGNWLGEIFRRLVNR